MTPTERFDANVNLARHVLGEVAVPPTPVYDRDDMFVAALEGLWRAARTFDETRAVPFANYACPLIRGEILEQARMRNHLRRVDRPIVGSIDSRDGEDGIAWEDLIVDPQATDPVRAAEQNVVVAEIAVAVRRLTPLQREVFWSVVARDEKARAVAARLGISEFSVAQARKLAARNLRQRLEVPCV